MTVNLEEEIDNIYEKISKLEKKKIFSETDVRLIIKEWVDEDLSCGQLSQISELKESFDRFVEITLSEVNSNVDLILKNREVLRELITALNFKEIISKDFSIHLKDKFEGKDGEKPSEPKKGCYNCKYLIDNKHCEEREMSSYKEFQYTTFLTAICNNWDRKEPTEVTGSARQTGWECPLCRTTVYWKPKIDVKIVLTTDLEKWFKWMEEPYFDDEMINERNKDREKYLKEEK